MLTVDAYESRRYSSVDRMIESKWLSCGQTDRHTESHTHRDAAITPATVVGMSNKTHSIRGYIYAKSVFSLLVVPHCFFYTYHIMVLMLWYIDDDLDRWLIMPVERYTY